MNIDLFVKWFNSIKRIEHKRVFIKLLITKRWIEPAKKPMAKLGNRDLLQYTEEMNTKWIEFCHKSGYLGETLYTGMLIKIFPRYVGILKNIRNK